MMNTDCVYHCQDEKCSLDTHKIFGLFRTTCNENRGLDCKHKCSYNHPVVKDVIERIQKEARSDKKIEEVDDKFSKISNEIDNLVEKKIDDIGNDLYKFLRAVDDKKDDIENMISGFSCAVESIIDGNIEKLNNELQEKLAGFEMKIDEKKEQLNNLKANLLTKIELSADEVKDFIKEKITKKEEKDGQIKDPKV